MKISTVITRLWVRNDRTRGNYTTPLVLIFIIPPPPILSALYTIMWLLHPSPWAKGNYASLMPHYAPLWLHYAPGGIMQPSGGIMCPLGCHNFRCPSGRGAVTLHSVTGSNKERISMFAR